MKLKKILAGILTGAIVISGIPAIGTADVVQAAPKAAEQTLPNVALGKKVTVSDYESGTLYEGNKLVDDIDTVSAEAGSENMWRSGMLSRTHADGTTTESSQWAVIDLEAVRTAVEEIEVTFYNDKNEWATDYEVQTSASGRNEDDAWVTLATVTRQSNANPLSEPDRISRMDVVSEAAEQEGGKLVLQRYVRFKFTGVNSYADSKRVSVAEIRIFGQTAEFISAPSVEFTAPVEGEYPALADVKADESEGAARHRNLADRTTPASTLLKADADVTPDEDGNINVTQDMLFESDEDFEVEEYEDGIWGFNARAKTVGIQNKFNADGDSIKIISFKLYMKKMSDKGSLNGGGGRTIYAKGDKFMMQADQDCLKISMKNTSNQWPSEYYQFSNDEKTEGNENYFFGKWHDILVVIDGTGKQRLYVDGKAGRSADENRPAVHPDVTVATPFSIFCSSDASNQDNWFGSEFGYMAQFKFYSNQSYGNIVNGAGTDITDADILDPEVAAKINIASLESANGGSRDGVAEIVNNLLQDQRPTVRFTLCPYDRSTIWEKFVDGSWQRVPAEEKFSDTSTAKYRVITTLSADDGFVFNQECRDNVEITDNGASHTVVNLSEHDRVLTITAYYNCEDAEVPGTCQLEALNLDSEEISMKLSDSTYKIPEPEAIITKCAKHEGANAKITYEVTKGTDYISVSQDGTITATKASKIKMGYAPVTVKVKAVLQDKDGNEIHETVDDVTELSKDISVYVYEEKEDQTITTAPTIATKVPQTGSYPEIADVKMVYPQDTDMSAIAKYDDIEDRMQPNATLDQTSIDFMNENIEKLLAARADLPDNQKNTVFGLTTRPTDLPESFEEPAIANEDGVWGFVGQGQTPGTENKFDVYGDDVKLITFKLYLKKWPTGTNVSIFGKGDKYAVQLTRDRKIIMYMENRTGGWPQENYNAPAVADGTDAFLNTWHDVFMVVDGKGKQRIYVDGVPSVTDSGRPSDAIAKENPSHGRQNFTIGYNLADTNADGTNTANWWQQMFTSSYGYIADFEFYTDKNYYGVINGAGTDISDAQTLSAEDAKFIDIAALENTYGTTGNIKTVLLNVLQQNNATAAITVTPYAAKTVWKEVKDGTQTILNPKNPVMGESTYISETTLTAYDGFKFSTEQAFKDAVKTNFSTDVEDKLSGEPTVEVSADGKTLTVTAQYAETDEAECTCSINSFASAITIEWAKNETDKTDDSLANLQIAKAPCAVAGHQEDSENTRVLVEAAIKGTTDVIELNTATNVITAKKLGTATIAVTAKYQVKGDDGNFTTVTNKDGNEVTRTADITVNVVRKDAADSAYKAPLIALIPKDGTYVEEDYKTDVWSAYEAALEEANRIKDESDVTKVEVDDAKDALQAAINALSNNSNKTEVGIKKDEVRAAVNNATTKAIYDAGNDDGTYTADSWSAFKTAYENASGDLTGKTASELDGLITALTTAEGGLKREADVVADEEYKESLKNLIPADNAYLAEDYDQEALEALQAAIEAAEDVINSSTATKGQVDAAKAALQDAIDALKEAKTALRNAKDALIAAVESAKEIYPSQKDSYTEASWKAFEDAYKAADLTEAQMQGKTVDELNGLKEALETAQGNLDEKPANPGPGPGPGPGTGDTGNQTVKDGEILTGADGTKYQVASAKDKTVIITKGIDARTIKVGPTVTIGKDTFKVIGIGSKAYTGLKKATKVIINANVASIGDQAFAKSKKLKNVTIGANVTTIGKKAFFNCPKLNKVTLKGTALTNKGVGKQAFKKTAAKVTVKWGKVKGKARTALKKALKKAGMKVK